jgi:plasmid stability protein
MTTLTISSLDPDVEERLRARAAEHGNSMEAEARQILEAALAPEAPRTGREWARRIRSRFEALGGVELDIPRRKSSREPPEFVWCSSSIRTSCRS